MSFPHPTEEEEAALTEPCPACKEPVDHWCAGEDGKVRPMLHKLRQPKQVDMVLGDRPEERGARAEQIPSPGTAYVLDRACRTCGHPAPYQVQRDDMSLEFACPLHLFSTIASALLGSDVIAVSMTTKKIKFAERRTLIEQAVQA